MLPNPCPPLAERAIDLVAVPVLSSLFYVRPSDADGFKEYVHKCDVMLAKLSALAVESEGLIKGFQQLNGTVKTKNRILKCFGKAALKISESFNGIEVVLASARSIPAPVPQTVQPCKSDAAPAKPVASAQGVAAPLKSTQAVSLANIVVSLPAASPKSKNRKKRRVAVQGTKAGSEVTVPGVANKMPSVSGKIPTSSITITAGVPGHRGVSTKTVSGEIQGTVTSVRGCEAHEADFRLGEITDGAGVKFIFLRETAYGWLKKGEQVKIRAQHNTGYNRRQAISIMVVSGTPPALSSVKEQAQDAELMSTAPADRQFSSSALSANAKSRQWTARSHKKVPLVIPMSVAAVTEAVSGSGDAGNVRLKVLEDLVAGLLKERSLPPVPPLSAPRK